MVRSEPATQVRRLIRTARQRKAWSQAELAAAAGIKSRTTIQNLENGMSLREGMESAVETALGLPIGAIDDVRSGRVSIEDALGESEPVEPIMTPVPESLPDVSDPEFWADLRGRVSTAVYEELWRLYQDRKRLRFEIDSHRVVAERGSRDEDR